jgi:hypothetical protein
MGTIKVLVAEIDGVELEYNQEYDLLSAIKYVETPPKKTSANLTSASNVTWAAVNDLQINMVAGKSYCLKYRILYKSSNAATGIAIQHTGTATFTSFSGETRTMTSGTLISTLRIVALNTAYTHGSVPTVNATTLLSNEIVFNCLLAVLLQ